VTVGGLVGEASRSINTSYSKGNVTGEDKVGGFAGSAVDIESCYTTGNVISPGEKVASFAFEADVDLSFSINSADSDIAFICVGNAGPETGIFRPEKISLQVGINSDSSSQIVMSTGFNFNLNINDITSDSTFRSVTEFIASLNQKATELGAIQNRLESALESTMVSMDNLTSSLSTIRDADMAKVSSEYIRQQILQQAAATLMSTANQTPAIALQLL